MLTVRGFPDSSFTQSYGVIDVGSNAELLPLLLRFIPTGRFNWTFRYLARSESVGTLSQSSIDYKFWLRACILSSFTFIVISQLIFRVTVREHLDRFIITFISQFRNSRSSVTLRLVATKY